VSTAAKKPVFIMNAATQGILKNNPYMIRFGNLTAQIEAPFGAWAAKNGIRSVYALFADYGPGLDAKNAFAKTFGANGGKVLGEIGVPISASDFTSYVQRMKDAKPDAAFVFLPLGPQAKQFFKAWTDAGMAKAGIKLIANGDLTDEVDLDQLGEEALGVVTAYTYSDTHNSPENRAFLSAWQQATGGKIRPDAFAVSAYDLMAALYRAVQQQGGKIDPERTIAIVRGMKLESPRGPLQIDPETREPIENVYIRRVERRNGRFENAEFETIPMVKDPGPIGQLK
jgi:branched-chain amino acid transport system substrate-binding protein